MKYFKYIKLSFLFTIFLKSVLTTASFASDSHVLLVDDSDMSHVVVGEILKRNNYKVKSVYDGKGAVDYLSTQNGSNVFAIIMDMQMKGNDTKKLDGDEAINQIRALNTPINQIPIIINSALSESEIRNKKLLKGLQFEVAKSKGNKESILDFLQRHKPAMQEEGSEIIGDTESSSDTDTESSSDAQYSYLATLINYLFT